MKMWWIRKRKYTWILLVTCLATVTFIFMKNASLKPNEKQPIFNDPVTVTKGKTVAEMRNKSYIHENKRNGRHKVKRTLDIGKSRKLQQTKKEPKRTDTQAPMPYIISEPQVKHVAFLKVDQAGSTLIQNILFRFGIRNGLTFVLPKQGNSVNSNSAILPIKPKNHYDIFACQTFYSPDQFSMMAPGYKTLAIVRDPLQRMISAANYYRNVYKMPYLTKTPIDNFIKELINNYTIHGADVFSKTRNSMAFDFGLTNKTTANSTTLDDYLLYLRVQFDLVLIADRLDESLVLMRREFNWMYKDIVYLKPTALHHSHVNLTKKEVEKFKSISFLDYKIYNMFYKIFDEWLTGYDKDFVKEFQEEVWYFRHILSDVNEFCLNSTAPHHLKIKETVWHEEFKITQGECEFMKLNEIQFLEKMKDRHRHMNGKEKI